MEPTWIWVVGATEPPSRSARDEVEPTWIWVVGATRKDANGSFTPVEPTWIWVVGATQINELACELGWSRPGFGW